MAHLVYQRIARSESGNTFDVPRAIAEKVPEEMWFRAEMTEEGILFRPVLEEEQEVPTPSWLDSAPSAQAPRAGSQSDLRAQFYERRGKVPPVELPGVRSPDLGRRRRDGENRFSVVDMSRPDRDWATRSRRPEDEQWVLVWLEDYGPCCQHKLGMDLASFEEIYPKTAAARISCALFHLVREGRITHTGIDEAFRSKVFDLRKVANLDEAREKRSA